MYRQDQKSCLFFCRFRNNIYLCIQVLAMGLSGGGWYDFSGIKQ